MVRVIEGATIYAYSSTPDQTDSDPFTPSAGGRVFKYLVANNCLKFNTVVRIFGKTYLVRDRMKAVYGCEVFDIWMPTREEARNFGVKRHVRVEIVKRVGND